ncbi:MAG: DUF1349 domain-containing protein [Chitinophagaceae bacterium]
MKQFILPAILTGAMLTGGCNSAEKTEQPVTKPAESTAPAQTSGKENGTACDITLNDIHFTKSINGADTLISEEKEKGIRFSVGEKKDYFNDPDGKLSNNTAPILLTKIDNTKPFTLTAKVTPGFTKSGLYNAGVLYVYTNDNHYQKFCFEQDERGDRRVVSVRTMTTSDDNNHDKVTQPFVYMKISSDAQTIGSYYSLDNKTWHLARLYRNDYGAELWTGISAQCPVDTGSFAYFNDMKLTQTSVKDFRIGE